MSIRVAVGQFHELLDEKLTFAAQIGASGIQMNCPNLPGDERWYYEDIKGLADKVRAAGLAFEAIENVPVHFYDKAMLGLPGRDQQIENYCATIEAIGQAGIPVLGYHFMPNSVWRTNKQAQTRGGALTTAFDMTKVEAATSLDEMRDFLPNSLGLKSSMPLAGPGEVLRTEEQMWENYRYFMEAVLPVAEAVGVTLALHPDDPPVPSLGGVARLFYKPENFVKAFEMVGNSPAWALDLCLGCCSEMPGGADAADKMIEFFVPKGRVAYVHFRDVQGTVPDFVECFLGDGNMNPAKIIADLYNLGFDGFILDDHVPRLVDDSKWGHRARAHEIGYIQGLIEMLRFNPSARQAVGLG